MRVTLQPTGRSPKQMNGSPSQFKPVSNNVQNNGTHLPSHVKGKKRDRGHHCFEPAKRERFSKTDDADSIKFRAECFLQSEIVKITDRGKLVGVEGVEKLVQLMLPEKNETKIELPCRTLFASVLAATDNFGCLTQFVELKGLPILDEWIQEAHKWKIDDASSPKDNDKSIDEFLLVLLRALDKLPVNLNALQTCNIGKSVNNLRTHKNLDIHRKARSLVDMWKKRVEVEMNIRDVRIRHTEVSHGGNKNLAGTSEATIKSSVSQVSLSRSTSVNPIKVPIAKSVSPGPSKLVSLSALDGNSSKDVQPTIGTFDPDQTLSMDEKSSNSSQSHNSQSCSSDHVKTVGFQGKEDTRSSSARSRGVNKMTACVSGHQKSVNGRCSSLHRKHTLEKLSLIGLTGENTNSTPFIEANNHKLIVKIPNRGQSLLNCASGGSFEDPSVMNSRASSPIISEKPEQPDPKERNDSYAVNVTSDVKTESWQSNDFKDILSVFDEEDRSLDSVPDEERFRSGDDDDMKMELPKASSSSSESEPNSGKFHDDPLSSSNALIETCGKSSEVNLSTSVGDDIGMNLLASVAAGEMLKSEFFMDSKITNDDNAKERLSGTNDIDCELGQPKKGDVRDIKKQCITSGTSRSKDDTPSEHSAHICFSSMNLKQIVDSFMETSSMPDRSTVVASMDDEGRQCKESSQLKLSTSEDKVNDCLSNGDCKKSAEESITIDTDVNSKKILLPSADKTNVSPTLMSHVLGDLCSCLADKSECIEENIENKEVFEHQFGISASPKGQLLSFREPELSCTEANETEECESTTADVSSFSAAGGVDIDKRLEFDLNKGLILDVGKSSAINVISPLPLPISSASGASITVVAAAKGPFMLPEDLLRSKGEIGWKGSAATSAFRPTEPRKVPDIPLCSIPGMRGRPPLDIDLNVPDERMYDDMACGNFAEGTGSAASISTDHDLFESVHVRSLRGLNLDLNRVDETTDIHLCSTSNGHRSHVSLPFSKSTISDVCPNNDATLEDFDLNNGPSLDATCVEPSLFFQHSSYSLPSQTQTVGVRMNNAVVGSLSSLFPRGNSFSTVTIPPVFPDPVVATGMPPMILGQSPFGHDTYVRSSGQFPSNISHYTPYPFWTSFPPPTTFSVGSTTYMDPSSAGKLCFPSVHLQFPRPYAFSIPDVSNNGGIEGNMSWGRQGFDLNAGPMPPDIEGRDKTFSLSSRNLSISGSQGLAEEHARMYEAVDGVLKKKVPERFSYS